jgi:hypothetical protein
MVIFLPQLSNRGSGSTLPNPTRTSQFVRFLRFSNSDGVTKATTPSTGHKPAVTVVCPGCDVANNWGFWYMGRFAADYRRQFGELPSVTLRRDSGSF